MTRPAPAILEDPVTQEVLTVPAALKDRQVRADQADPEDLALRSILQFPQRLACRQFLSHRGNRRFRPVPRFRESPVRRAIPAPLDLLRSRGM